MPLLPRYSPIRNLPSVNKSAVTAAPTQTSPQRRAPGGV